MTRSGLRITLLVFGVAAALSAPQSARAQAEPAPPGSDEPAAPASGEPAPPGSTEPAAPGTQPASSGSDAAPGDQNDGRLGSISWRDIVTVPRRPILKYHRIELIPTYNVSLNNPLVRSHGFGGVINFFLSETLNLGIEGTYYAPQQLSYYELIGLDDRVVPSANKNLWSASLNFGYVPVYGKFSIFNKFIFQWETYIQAGIGATQTEWIPRDPKNAAATNTNVLWHVDLGWRLFLTKWLAIHAYLKDYMMIDKFEPTNPRCEAGTGGANCVATTAVPPSNTFVSQFVQNIVFGVGVGMFLPTGFEYKYTR